MKNRARSLLLIGLFTQSLTACFYTRENGLTNAIDSITIRACEATIPDGTCDPTEKPLTDRHFIVRFQCENQVPSKISGTTDASGIIVIDTIIPDDCRTDTLSITLTEPMLFESPSTECMVDDASLKVHTPAGIRIYTNVEFGYCTETTYTPATHGERSG